ncbi:glycosyltransferase family 2 protein [Parapedobacter sp. 10938]|uniref:glycosyltransferase family 2 protein n=1 Tax=Parapedobacter flavus TaxID=3110225 RepID=UPI002DBCBC93|nr:glycosyltransferase family 2 protein [Parapedobacter sp. 10938]MEC3878250.1 glycosyltransferase family 2 protein [Parapedobacter sp. 10938]
MSPPLFSIIIPTYNAGRTLSRCLESILKQTDTDIEVIIQDGGSTDDTAQIAEGFDTDRIHFFAEPDNGIYDAMNKAIERSTGTWLLFLGSDDYLYGPAVLADIRKALTGTTAQLVYGNVKMVGDTPWAKDGAMYRGETSAAELMLHNYSHQATFYHRGIFDDGHRYNPKYRVCADYDFNLLCTAKYHVQYIPIVVSCFVSGGFSSINEDELFIQDMWTNVIRYFGSKLRTNPFFPFRKNMKKAAEVFYKRFDLYHALVALSLYLYHSSRKGRFSARHL